MSPTLFRNILVAFSGLSFGSSLYAIMIHFLNFKVNPKLHIGFILGRIAWLLTVGMVFITILLPITQVPPTWQGYVYLLGLVIGSIGFFMIARATRRLVYVGS